MSPPKTNIQEEIFLYSWKKSWSQKEKTRGGRKQELYLDQAKRSTSPPTQQSKEKKVSSQYARFSECFLFIHAELESYLFIYLFYFGWLFNNFEFSIKFFFVKKMHSTNLVGCKPPFFFIFFFSITKSSLWNEWFYS